MYVYTSCKPSVRAKRAVVDWIGLDDLKSTHEFWGMNFWIDNHKASPTPPPPPKRPGLLPPYQLLEVKNFHVMASDRYFGRSAGMYGYSSM